MCIGKANGGKIMTPQEALKVIDKTHDYPCPYGIGGTAWLYIRNCIEKQIPKKPKLREGTTYTFCPCCDSGNLQNDYCTDCGQKIDWSDTDEQNDR